MKLASPISVGVVALALVSWLGAGAPAHAEGADKAPAAEKPTKAKTKPAAEGSKAAGEVVLKGDMMCAKCALKETDKCQGVLKVKEAGKDVNYYLADNAVAHDNHATVCSGSSPATVKGKVTESGGKKTLAATEIKFN